MPLLTGLSARGDEGALLDRLQYAVLLYGEDARIVALNRHAANLLARSRSLTLRGEELYCHDALQRGRLAQLLAAAAAGRGGSLLIEAGGEPPLSVLAVPLASVSQDLGVAVNPDASRLPVSRFALVLGTHDAVSRTTLAAFATLYRLTPAERRVLDELSHDYSPREIADHCGVSVRTVDAQLASIYGKTATNSQRKLLSLLREIPPFSFA